MIFPSCESTFIGYDRKQDHLNADIRLLDSDGQKGSVSAVQRSLAAARDDAAVHEVKRCVAVSVIFVLGASLSRTSPLIRR